MPLAACFDLPLAARLILALPARFSFCPWLLVLICPWRDRFDNPVPDGPSILGCHDVLLPYVTGTVDICQPVLLGIGLGARVDHTNDLALVLVSQLPPIVGVLLVVCHLDELAGVRAKLPARLILALPARFSFCPWLLGC